MVSALASPPARSKRRRRRRLLRKTRFHRGDECREAGLEGGSDPDHVQEAHVPLATLYAANIGSVQAGEIRQLLLRKLGQQSPFADGVSEGYPCVWSRAPPHGSNLGGR